jgi:pimeloyl-ACP methyl ester carboxylesterase
VVGQSAGGTIALMAAARRPESFLALGLWEAPVIWTEWWPSAEAYDSVVGRGRHPDPEQLGEEFNRFILGDDRWGNLPERTRALLRAEGAAFRSDLASQEHAPFRLEDVRIPVIVASGRNTGELMIGASERLAEAVGGEHIVFDDADHFAHLSNPRAWASLVRRTVALAEETAGRQPGRLRR